MKTTILSAALLIALAGSVFAQGSLTPPPGPPAPAMKSLQNLWDKLGTLESQSTGHATQLSALQQEHATQTALINALHAQTQALQAQNSALQTQNQTLSTMLNNMSEAAGTLPWTGGIIEAGVGSSSVSTEKISLVLAPDGQPAAAYVKVVNNFATLRYAKYNGTSWTATTVDSTAAANTGFFASLAFSPAGQPAISYYDATSQDLRYASFNGSSWQITTVASTGNTGRHTSLAFSPSGQPAIAYEDYSDSKLKYASFNGTTWSIANVYHSLDAGRHNSLHFHPNTGLPVIASHDQNATDLIYSTYNGAAWTNTTLRGSSEGTSGLSMQFTPDARPATAFSAIAYGFDLEYGEWQNGRWNYSRLDTPEEDGIWPSLAFNAAGKAFISYASRHTEDGGATSTYRLHLASRQGLKWTTAPVAEDIWMAAPAFTSLIIMPGGQPAVAFKDVYNTWHFRVRQPL